MKYEKTPKMAYKSSGAVPVTETVTVHVDDYTSEPPPLNAVGNLGVYLANEMAERASVENELTDLEIKQAAYDELKLEYDEAERILVSGSSEQRAKKYNEIKSKLEEAERELNKAIKDQAIADEAASYVSGVYSTQALMYAKAGIASYKPASKPLTGGNSMCINDIWDPITITRINELHPAIQESTIEFILAAQSQGINLRITGAYRSYEEQEKLYAQGRTEPGNIVTNGRGGQSYHNFGLAFDVVEIKDGEPLWEDTNWDFIGALGKQFGFEWGGEWIELIDKPHFQMTFDLSLSDLHKSYQNNDYTDGYVNIR
ncbi:MAG: D-alanyl-D-alanine carboxypeptidase family protein [Oscillospiraceae bacterium]|nr:D-alanyl-D-alanine carboxypeptidase family protein [Oscillospiraceae bacterium]